MFLVNQVRVRAAKYLREWIKRAEESNLKEFELALCQINLMKNQVGLMFII